MKILLAHLINRHLSDAVLVQHLQDCVAVLGPSPFASPFANVLEAFYFGHVALILCFGMSSLDTKVKQP